MSTAAANPPFQDTAPQDRRCRLPEAGSEGAPVGEGHGAGPGAAAATQVDGKHVHTLDPKGNTEHAPGAADRTPPKGQLQSAALAQGKRGQAGRRGVTCSGGFAE